MLSVFEPDELERRGSPGCCKITIFLRSLIRMAFNYIRTNAISVTSRTRQYYIHTPRHLQHICSAIFIKQSKSSYPFSSFFIGNNKKQQSPVRHDIHLLNSLQEIMKKKHIRKCTQTFVVNHPSSTPSPHPPLHPPNKPSSTPTPHY